MSVPDIVKYKQGSRYEPDLFQTCSQITVRKGRLGQKSSGKAVNPREGRLISHGQWGVLYPEDVNFYCLSELVME